MMFLMKDLESDEFAWDGSFGLKWASWFQLKWNKQADWIIFLKQSFYWYKRCFFKYKAFK